MPLNGYVPFFVEGAHNVYRTPHFIVRQELKVCENAKGETTLVSYDTFYPRCHFVDYLYEAWFEKRENIDGRRMPCREFVREYSH